MLDSTYECKEAVNRIVLADKKPNTNIVEIE